MSYFSPDVRNIGGRRLIATIMSHHFNRMIEVGPSISNRATSEFPRRDFSQSIRADPLSESWTNPTDKLARTSKQGAMVDCEEPESVKFTSKISKNRKLKLKGNKDLHRKNIENMQRRICEYSSPIERKKNSWDPVSRPVMFFRSKAEASRLKLNSKFIQKVLKPPKSTEVFELVTKSGHSSPSKNKTLSPSQKIGKQMLDTILVKRLFRDGELEEVFSQARLQNPQLKDSVVDEAIDLVMKQLDN